ncbi:uncharacterized protein B0H18DRAFT_377361 [Fomitopsis serialis]|uniref:uncharacterized protein n=1 Tax=Fomitopsis serialis TaxID=139415 RepID=UPI002008D0C7|nr:uncharacterized protein B0H18DRAFT_377361 [Neoantrodia serialis]KAH9925575.1 hypothetical protein B0H18DRAFT_377361 [Neoantrodia serialis]
MPSATAEHNWQDMPCVSINGMLVRVQITFDTEQSRPQNRELTYGEGSDPESMESAAITAAAGLVARIFHHFLHNRLSDSTQTYHARCIVLDRPPPGTEFYSHHGVAEGSDRPSDTAMLDGSEHYPWDNMSDIDGDSAAEMFDGRECADFHGTECTAERHISQACGFGTPCGVPITDGSLEGLKRHLLEYHRADLPRSAYKDSGADC